jgi:hypothetical protein
MPTKEFEVQLPASAIEEFRERGFTRFHTVTTDEEIEWLREVYDLLFSGEVTLPKGTLVNDVNRPASEQRGQLNGQLLYPETFYPGLRRTLLYRNTQSLARQLFGTQELQGWTHLARKAPRMTEDLPWHQDEAYWDPTFDYESAAFWMPLDTATMQSGAMSFLPGSHKGDILHCSFPDNDPTRTTVLIDEEFDRSTAVPQPIPIGGVSIHHCRTLHASGPNLTDAARRAYIHVWGCKPVKREISHDRPWYWQKVLKNSTIGVVQSRRDDVEKIA